MFSNNMGVAIANIFTDALVSACPRKCHQGPYCTRDESHALQILRCDRVERIDASVSQMAHDWDQDLVGKEFRHGDTVLDAKSSSETCKRRVRPI